MKKKKTKHKDENRKINAKNKIEKTKISISFILSSISSIYLSIRGASGRGGKK